MDRPNLYCAAMLTVALFSILKTGDIMSEHAPSRLRGLAGRARRSECGRLAVVGEVSEDALPECGHRSFGVVRWRVVWGSWTTSRTLVLTTACLRANFIGPVCGIPFRVPRP